MKELLTRSLFGLIYVIIVLVGLQVSYLRFWLFFIFMLLALIEFGKLIKVHNSLLILPAIAIYFLSSSFQDLYFDLNIERWQNLLIAFAILILMIPLIQFILGKITNEILSGLYLSMFYIVFPFALLLHLDWHLILFVFVIIWSSDSFAYLAGSNFGKHKLAPHISPKKSVEGLVGGLVGSIIVSILYYFLAKETSFDLRFSIYIYLMYAIVIVIFGTLGDLLESKFKRGAGVKDSGKIMPGHGGILDRLDSFIFAIPFVFVLFLILK